MSKILLSIWPYRIVRMSLGMLFFIVGFAKLLDPKAFAKALSMYEIIPEKVLPLVAVGLPLTEVLAGLGLILNIRGSLTVISGLLVLFIAVLYYGILRVLDIGCGCYMPWERPEHAGLKSALYRDFILLVMVIYLYLWQRVSPYRHNIKSKNIRRRI
jgi:uncharacterized membrane protein YphA (DoxX/SURF4 family)